MRNMIVTGGCGFIGSNFIRYMLSKYEDLRITNVDRMSYGSNPTNLESYSEDPRYTFLCGDISNRGLMNRVVHDADVIVNFAAESHVDRSIAGPWPFMKSNTEGTMAILEAIRRKAVDTRLVHVSTDEVYGDIPKGSVDEEAKLNPSSPYAVSKAAADLLCLAYVRTYGLNATITRSTNNFGPLQFPEKMIPKSIIRAQLGLSLPVYGNGRNVRDWIYVTDHCEAIDLVVRKGKPGEKYNIAGRNEIENIALVKMILRLMRKSESLVQFVEDRPGHDRRYSLNDKKVREELDWSPRHTFTKALKETVEWYLENEHWWRPIVDEKVLSPSPWRLAW